MFPDVFCHESNTIILFAQKWDFVPKSNRSDSLLNWNVVLAMDIGNSSAAHKKKIS